MGVTEHKDMHYAIFRYEYDEKGKKIESVAGQDENKQPHDLWSMCDMTLEKLEALMAVDVKSVLIPKTIREEHCRQMKWDPRETITDELNAVDSYVAWAKVLFPTAGARIEHSKRGLAWKVIAQARADFLE